MVSSTCFVVGTMLKTLFAKVIPRVSMVTTRI